MTLETWILTAFLLVIPITFTWVIRLLLAQYVRRQVRRETMLTPVPAMNPECRCTRPWVIVNPSKHADLSVLKAQIEKTAAEMGISQIQWYKISVEDPNAGQVLRAVALDASLVITADGDGTVHAVAAGLTGVGVRMGIIPVRTGNLLARNLELPVGDVPTAVRVALGNERRLVDCGRLRADGVEEPSSLPAEDMLVRAAHTCLRMDEGIELPKPESLPSANEYSFVVISGLGFDGETIAKANPELKKHIGWVAYVIAALGAMTTAQTGMHVIPRCPRPSDDPVGDAPATLSSGKATAASTILRGEELSDAPEQEVAWTESKSLIFADCRDLSYVTLTPRAHLDDDLLGMIAVDTQASLPGQASLSWEILFQRLSLKTLNLADSTGQIHFRQAEGVPVRVHAPQIVQVDDDPARTATIVYVRIDQSVLDVSVSEIL